MPRFRWNNETITNSYGFRVLNKGGDFARFTDNPVMQNSHYNTTKMNLGSWKDWSISGFELSGETVFDSARDEVKEVEGQVERGFIKACSMGIAISWDDDSWQKAPDGVWELVKWELMEVSICAIPSLSSALALYDKATMELITEDQIKLSVVNLSAEKVKPNNPKMEKIILSTAAMAVLVGLNITSADNVSEISNAIVKLNADKTAADNKVIELQGKLDLQLKGAAKALADQAVLDGKITQGEHEELMNDAIANLTLTSKLVAKMPGKESLNAKLKKQNGGEATIKTMDDFDKLTHKEQLAFRDEQPEAYKEMFA